jgi:large subunit ribosomal protein L24
MAWKIKKGDTVVVIAGGFKGAEGKVLRVDRDGCRVTVEGVGVRSRAMRPSPQRPEGGVVRKETSIHISNVALSEGGKPTRVGFRMVGDKKERYSKRSQSVL